MTFPVLPGLDSMPSAGPSLAAVLDALDDSQIEELATEAGAYAQGQEGTVDPTAEETAPEDEAEEEDDGVSDENGEGAPVDDEATDDEELPPESEKIEDDTDATNRESVEGMAEGGDYDGMLAWVDERSEELQAIRDECAGFGEAAAENAELGADVDALNEILDRIEEKSELLDTAKEECETAAANEDAKGCGEACLRVEKIMRTIRALREQARAEADATSTGEAKVADDPAVKLWAERTALKSPF